MKTLMKTGEKIFFLIVLFVFLALVVLYWGNTWDDSAITLAFSRNLAKYGDITPSQFSDRVEGYSTALWMFINTGFFLLGLSEQSVLVLAKCISTFLTLINILLFWRLLQENTTNGFYRFVFFILYVINLQTVTAAVFGMETALYALLVMTSYLLFRKKNDSRLAYFTFTAVASLLIIIRHEGPLFLIPFVLETIRVEPRRFWREPYLHVWAIVFLAYHAWHFAFFGEFLTNPMIAKRQPPYRPEFSSALDLFSYYLFPFSRFLAVYPFLVLLLAVYFIRLRNLRPAPVASKQEWYLIYGIAFAGVFIMLVTGRSWNADADRLSYPALSFTFLVIAGVLDRIPPEQLIPNGKGIYAFVFGLGMLLNMAAIVRSFTSNQQFHFTVEEFRRVTHLVTLTQEHLGMERVTFAGPDMGSLLLLDGDGKRIIDLGLLCNKPLAANGHGIVDEYVLQQESPEIIEIHDNWVEPFETSEIFYEMYFPVQIVDGRNEGFFFIRKDLMAKLENAEETVFTPKKSIEPNLARVLENYGKYVTVSIAQ